MKASKKVELNINLKDFKNYNDLFTATSITPTTKLLDKGMKQPIGTRRILNGNIFTFTYSPITNKIVSAKIKPWGTNSWYDLVL